MSRVSCRSAENQHFPVFGAPPPLAARNVNIAQPQGLNEAQNRIATDAGTRGKMDRRGFVAMMGGGLAAPRAFAQGLKVWRIGFLAGSTRPPSMEESIFGGFLQGMRERGYVEDRDFVMEWRFADGKFDRFPVMAASLVRQNVDLIVAPQVALPAARRATAIIPIVMSYGQPLREFFRKAASYADRILKGARPGDLPMEQPNVFELVIDLRTAKSLGLTIPRSVLLRADRVIE